MIQKDQFNELSDYFRLISQRMKSLENVHEQSAFIITKIEEIKQV